MLLLRTQTLQIGSWCRNGVGEQFLEKYSGQIPKLFIYLMQLMQETWSLVVVCGHSLLAAQCRSDGAERDGG